MALAPTNLTMKEIATRSRLPERSLSTLISRLEKDGHVRPANRSSGKGTVYELSEGLFRLWYQYRKGRPVLEPLVEFLVYWYRAEELERVVEALRQKTDGHNSTRAAELALLQVEEALRRASSHEGKQERERIWAECQQALHQEKTASQVQQWTDTAASHLSLALEFLEKPDGVEHGRVLILRLLQEAQSTNGKFFTSLLEYILQEIFGNRLSTIDPAASSVLASIVEAFKDDTRPAIQRMVAQARVTLAIMLLPDRSQEALAEANTVLDLKFLAHHWWLQVAALYARGNVFLHLKKPTNAIEDFERALEIADRNNPHIVQPITAGVLEYLLVLYTQEKKGDRARSVAEQTITRFGSLQEEPFRLRVANARAWLAFHSGLHLRDPKVIQELDKWLNEYGSIDEPGYPDTRVIIELTKALHQALSGDASAHQLVTRCIRSFAQGKARETSYFFQLAASLFIAFGPKAMKNWLTTLSKAPLPEGVLLLVSWHLMASEVLLAEDSPTSKKSPASSSSSKAWARIPPELRENVKDLVRQVREFRDEPDTLGLFIE
jgi:tetratricopeptide (TPR) repeat protein